ncbi:PadR family transcriptional regulator (plasmid) [Arthrobacter sp. G.S.26]|uniref:PadR family transcriptional regulator n=1 Tax=Arthrobacter sp. G.S.26 TaxID=3433706 RepID=UPI003D788785
MGRRKQGTLLTLEIRILEIVEEAKLSGKAAYGFSLASTLAAEGGTMLAAHGTLYKALSRLSEAGFLEAEWESPEIAEHEGRPRRRLYSITAPGRTALQLAQVTPAPNPNPMRTHIRPARA